ncbi:MAG TPA: UvrD-helicase domain-containing protein [Solirubrobacterales bacterium]|nr:UvrD-helicase domain-containing protein [Solirubrobacterales bacterium]
MSERIPTPEQAAAIGTAGRDVLVEAGAGAGKTGVMVDRYCRLVCEKGLRPDAILAFTFTDKAATELRQRISAELARRAVAGDRRAGTLLAGIGGAWVTTIHGFCNRLLAGHPVAAGIDPRFRVLDAPETTRVAREAFDEALVEFMVEGSESREETVAAFGIDVLRTMVTGAHAELRSRGVAAPRLPEPPAPKTPEDREGGEAYRHVAILLELFSSRFEAAKERRAGIDFEDLQILATRLLERAEIGEAYRARFSHLMVDEFQDTNRLQLRLIEALRGPGSELMVVGDEFQSIYGFRHADLDVFRERRLAMEESAGAATMELSGNFRSRPEVIGAVNALGGELLGDSFRPLRVGAPPSEPAPPGVGPAVELLLTARDGWDEVGIDLAPTVDGRTPLNCLAEARFVAARLGELADAGIPRGEMVVLLRAFTHLDAYEDSLERAGLRPYVVGGRGYWSQQQVADVCALLATIANPLDDQALFGALASPACGLAPDTLWLLRAAAGKRRHVWPAVEQAIGVREAELAEPDRLTQIPESEVALLRRFAETIAALRERGTRLSLAGLIDAAVTDTGYDLAVLMRPSGEARFANVRKLMRLAAEFESREGRDLRGLLDFLATRAEVDAEAQAATAAEGHDGVRIMTVHNAKGLEFGVVAVPDLSRSLLAGSRAPLLTIGREAEEPRIGMQLRRLGAGSINLYSYAELCEEAKQRDSEEGLRLFHVAATRARERLILSGVVKPEPGRETKPGTPVIERIVDGFEIDRERASTIPAPPPQPRDGLDATFASSEIAVRVNLPSAQRGAELAAIKREAGAAPKLGKGPAPLARPTLPTAPVRPLSYTAISGHEEDPNGFRVEGETPGREEGATRGIAVHSLLEWSQANGWLPPLPEPARRFATAAGLDPDTGATDALKAVQAWLESDFFAERIRGAKRARAEVPILLSLAGTVLRGSIDLLVEDDDRPPLIVDYKTDRLGATTPAEHVRRYETQRNIYALAVSEARGVDEVEVAYVFLERPEEPVLETLDRTATEAGRQRLEATIARLAPVIK